MFNHSIADLRFLAVMTPNLMQNPVGAPPRPDVGMVPNAGPMGHPSQMAFMQMPGAGMQQPPMQQQKPPQNYPGPVPGPLMRNVNQAGQPGGGMQMQMQPPQQQNAQRFPNPQMNPQMMGQGFNMVLPGFAGYPFPGMPGVPGPYNQAPPQYRPPQPMLPNQQMSNLQQMPPQMGGGSAMGMGSVDRMTGPPPNMNPPYPEPPAPQKREKKTLFQYDKSTKTVLKQGAEKEKAPGEEQGSDHASAAVSEAAHFSSAAAATVPISVLNGSDAQSAHTLPPDSGGKGGAAAGRQLPVPNVLPVSAVSTAANVSEEVGPEKDRMQSGVSINSGPEKVPVNVKPLEPKTPTTESKDNSFEKVGTIGRPVTEEKTAVPIQPPTPVRAEHDGPAIPVVKENSEPSIVASELPSQSSGAERPFDAAVEMKDVVPCSLSEDKGLVGTHTAAPVEERKKPLVASTELEEGETSLRPAQREGTRGVEREAPNPPSKRSYEIEFLLKFQKRCTKEASGLNLKNSPELCRLTGANVPEGGSGSSGSANPTTPRGSQISNAPQGGGPAARPQQRNNNQTRGGGQMGGGRNNYNTRPSMGPPVELRKGENAYDTSKTKPQNHTERIMKVRVVGVAWIPLGVLLAYKGVLNQTTEPMPTLPPCE